MIIAAGGRSRRAQDQLRTLIMNPKQPEFWTARFAPSEQPVAAPRRRSTSTAAIKNALANRTDLLEFKKQMESTDINLKYARQPEAAGGRPERALRPDRRRRHAASRRIPTASIASHPQLRRRAARRLRQRLQDLELRASTSRTRSAPARPTPPTRRPSCSSSRISTTLANLEMQVTASVRDAGREREHQPEAGRSDHARRASSPSSASTPRTSASRSGCRARSSCSRPSATCRWPGSAS